jgi:predicted MFS family arabinose efflux permease
VVLLAVFAALERYKDRHGAAPLFPFSQLAYPSYHYGMLTTGLLAAGEFTMFFALSLVLQDVHHYSALRTGLWVLPFGVTAIVGAGTGVGLAGKFGAKHTVVIGRALETAGLTWVAIVIGPGISLARLIPAIITYGIGIGFATAQLGIAMVGSAYSSGARPAVLVAAGCVCLGVIAATFIPSPQSKTSASSEPNPSVSIR